MTSQTKITVRARANSQFIINPTDVEVPENIDDSIKKKNVPPAKATIRAPILKYETFMWIIFNIITVLSILDRFFWNIWPRQNFSIGSGSAGSDRLEGFKPGPWSVVLYDALARLSGRYSIVCYNFLLVTRLKSLEYWLVTSFVSRHLLDCGNIVHANNRLHNYTGIGLCVLTLLHVWSILLPCLTHGYTAKVIPGVWEWPLSERNPVKCSVEDIPGCWPGDANIDLKQMGLQADDVFRMVEMTLFLMILMPLSIKWLATRWHAAIQLHRLINLVYFVDIVRRHSHPHSWILNTPVFLIYICDAYIWSNYWRRVEEPEIKRVKLGEDYMVLYWASSVTASSYVAPHYSMVMKKSSPLENKHIFTCFENRLSHPIISSFDNGEKEEFEWSAGCVIRVFFNTRKPRLGKLESYSHTKRMYEEEPNMIITGPIPGEMSLKLHYALHLDGHSSIVIVGAGSAVNFILDTLIWLGSKNDEAGKFPHITIIYTSRDENLFEWSTNTFAEVMEKLDKGISSRIDLKLSQTGDDGFLEETEIGKSRLSASMHSLKSSVRSLSVFNTRINLYDEIAPQSKVFCQGSTVFKACVEKVCKKVGSSFFGGEGGH